MNARPPATLLSIALALKLSKMSVSLALRDRPGVSEGVRAKVKAEANRQGYQPDPISSEMMRLVRARRHHDGARTIAFINTFQDPTLMWRIPGFREFIIGARTRAVEYGYRLEVFEARSEGMTNERLADILYARGIKGVLIGPRWALESPLEFPWERFASVIIGEPEYGPNLHRVSNHHAHTCLTVLRKLTEKGYRKIGLMLLRPFEEKAGYDHLMGAEQFRLSTDGSAEVYPFLPEVWDDAEGEAWAQKEKLDALVSLSHWPIGMLDRIRAPDGGRLGFAGLNVFSGQTYSGINQHTEEIGSAGMALLRDLLISGERGTVPRPRILLLEGEWVEGETTPGPLAGISSGSKRRHAVRTASTPKTKRGMSPSTDKRSPCAPTMMNAIPGVADSLLFKTRRLTNQ